MVLGTPMSSGRGLVKFNCDGNSYASKWVL